MANYEVEQVSAKMTCWKQKDQERSALLVSVSELIQVRNTKHLLQKLVDSARSLKKSARMPWESHFPPAPRPSNALLSSA